MSPGALAGSWGADGARIGDFRAEGTLGFELVGDFLVAKNNVELPFKVPRVHAAKNIGEDTYNEILFEHKHAEIPQQDCQANLDSTSGPKSSYLARKVGGILNKLSKAGVLPKSIAKIGNRLSPVEEL